VQQLLQQLLQQLRQQPRRSKFRASPHPSRLATYPSRRSGRPSPDGSANRWGQSRHSISPPRWTWNGSRMRAKR
jgi:hypothetical protein